MSGLGALLAGAAAAGAGLAGPVAVLAGGGAGAGLLLVAAGLRGTTRPAPAAKTKMMI